MCVGNVKRKCVWRVMRVECIVVEVWVGGWMCVSMRSKRHVYKYSEAGN